MTAQLATREGRAVSRPLKVLIPMINGELELGDTAGAEHYANAGDMLIEAKEFAVQFDLYLRRLTFLHVCVTGQLTQQATQ